MRSRAAVLLAVLLFGSATAVAAQPSGDPAPLTGRDPRSRALYLSLIEDLRRSGRTHAALAHLDAFAKTFPNAPDAEILRADCLVELKDLAGATTVYLRLLRGPASAAAEAGLGRVEALRNNWSTAADHYARAVALAPTMPSYLNDYGFALLHAGRAADAVFRLRQAAELAPADTRVRNNLILALAAAGNAPEARRLLAAVVNAAERAELESELAAQAARAATPR